MVDDCLEMVDLSVGLFDLLDGVRVESRFIWVLGFFIMWKKDVKGIWREGFVVILEENMEVWRVVIGREKFWLRVDKERSV